MFKNDAFLWYNMPVWSELGLAVPNWSDDTHSQNGTIRYLTQVMGKNLQGIMFHADANLSTPPSINTLTRVHKLCTRARSILSSRAVPASTPNMESAHAIPSPEVFNVFPAPYFKVKNQWMKEYASLVLTAITECFQHQENAKPLEVSTDFAGLIGQYLHRVYRLMAVELFRVPVADAAKPDFTLTDAQLTTYAPSTFFTSTEMIDTVPLHTMQPTEDDLKVISNGIAVTMLPQLGPYPNTILGVGPVQVQSNNNPAGESFAPAPTP
jgi:hypothetical protein